MGCLTPQVTYEEHPANMVALIDKATNTYSVDKYTMPFKITTGIYILSAPVGSQAFAENFFLRAVNKTRIDVAKLYTTVTDLQTRLRLFHQYVIEQLPHLLGDEVLHMAPLNFPPEHGEE